MGNVALQLYSVRDHTEKDFLGTIKKVAEMGYDAVQFAGFFDTPASEVKAVLEECALKVAGAHIGIDQLTEDKMEETLRYQRMIGNDLIICPWLPEEMRDSKEAYQRTAERLNQIGERCRREGFVFAYHNHAFEFEKLDGQTGFDLLFAETDPDRVKVELDCMWALVGGYDPAEIIETYKNRVVSLHLKDMKTVDGEKVSTEIGNGTLDFGSILEAAQKHGVRWLTVEQENYERDSLESVRICVQNLKQLLAKQR